MKSFLSDPYTITTARLLIGLLFVLSGATKLQDPKGFTMAVYNFRLLPPALADLYATLIPFIELACGVLLVVGLFTQVAGLVAFLTLLSFTVAIGWNLTRGQHPDCHCFGNLFSEELSSVLVIRNVVLLLIVSTAIVTPSTYLALDTLVVSGRGAAALPLVDGVACLLLALAGIAVVLLAGQVSATISANPWVESPWPSFNLRRKR